VTNYLICLAIVAVWLWIEFGMINSIVWCVCAPFRFVRWFVRVMDRREEAGISKRAAKRAPMATASGNQCSLSDEKKAKRNLDGDTRL